MKRQNGETHFQDKTYLKSRRATNLRVIFGENVLYFGELALLSLPRISEKLFY